jgi:hypothetical protein
MVNFRFKIQLFLFFEKIDFSIQIKYWRVLEKNTTLIENNQVKGIFGSLGFAVVGSRIWGVCAQAV